MRLRQVCAAILLAATAFVFLSAAPPDAIPTPSHYLQMSIGADGVLADYQQIASYFRELDRLSDRITVQELGRTTMDLPYLAAIVTSADNQKRLEHYRTLNNRLYDPRRTSDDEARRLIAEGRTIVAIQMGIHSSEVGAPQMSMELAHRFATDDSPRMRDVLDKTIVILSPSHNPDGAQMVAEWNRRTAGTRFEGGPLPFLYQKYVGHDNNRDWYMFTQKESQITVSKIWNHWHPQISYDMHQMGSAAARIFMPPYVDPTDPNVDPILRAEINALGTAMASRLTADGKDGVVVNAMYDMWTPARAYVNYHGGVRILTEVASARLATPIDLTFDQLGRGIGYDARVASWNFPRPWRGGRWRLRDIMDYEHAATDALLDHAVRYRDDWLTNFYRVGRNAVGRRDPETGAEKPYAIVFPAGQRDPLSAYQLLWALQFGDVEIGRARAPFTADGRQYPAGSHVISMAQPASAFAKTLCEIQRYPDLRQYPGGPPQRPYDVTAYTLPLLMGVEAVFVQKPFDADIAPVASPVAAPAGTVARRARGAYAFAHDSAGIRALNRLGRAGLKTRWSDRPFTAGGRLFPAGAIVVPVAGQDTVHAQIAAAARVLPVQVAAIDATNDVPSGIEVRLPRVGLYQSHMPSMDEGWTRWIFEQWGLPFTSLTDRAVKGGRLHERYDAIVVPDQDPSSIVSGFRPGTVPDEYVGGLGAEGVAALRLFVENGGTLVTLDSASLLAVHEFGLPVTNAIGLNDADGRAAFYAPGSIVRTHVDITHPIAFGAEKDGIAWIDQSPAFDVRAPARAVVRYPGQGNPLLSGWLLGGDRLHGRAAVVEAPLGRGRVVLFGFRPQYRAQTWSTFGLLFNALYYATMPAAVR